ncbi:MAG: metal-dependent hydrolase [Candidatus Bathyarchaeia archaeon]|jgi:membrane-bound metal-dependent hydrolase YbcI (DUF457 family)
MSLGYILGKTSSKFLKTNLNIPLVLTLSILPDMDILAEHVPGLAPILQHRGPTHSFVVSFIIFIPFFVVYRKTAVPYFIALVQHALIGDYLTGGGLQLFWPISQQRFGLAGASIMSAENVALEFSLFVVSLAILLITLDIVALFQAHRSNLILVIPIFTVLLPTFLSYPLTVPAWLIVPHLVYMVLFAASVIFELPRLFRSQRSQKSELVLSKQVYRLLGRRRRPCSQG